MRLIHPASKLAFTLALAAGMASASLVRADDAPAKATGTLTGKVLDDKGQPAKGVKVSVFAAGAFADRKAKAPGTTDAPAAPAKARPTALATAVTGDDGTYTLSDVPVGKVRVVAGGKGSGIGFARNLVAVVANQTTQVEEIKLRAAGSRKPGGTDSLP